jgi:hypothetical protein
MLSKSLIGPRIAKNFWHVSAIVCALFQLSIASTTIGAESSTEQYFPTQGCREGAGRSTQRQYDRAR